LPYPRELERIETVAGFSSAVLRPIRPEDAAALEDLLAKSTPDDTRLRFFAPLRKLAPRQLARMTQIDYDREMALVLMARSGAQALELIGVVHLIGDPDNERAEFALTVRSDVKGHGLGWALMQQLISYARARGIGRLHGAVLRDNDPMIKLCHDLGFTVQDDPDDSTVYRAVLVLK
jgi:acetyltransferase